MDVLIYHLPREADIDRAVWLMVESDHAASWCERGWVLAERRRSTPSEIDAVRESDETRWHRLLNR